MSPSIGIGLTPGASSPRWATPLPAFVPGDWSTNISTFSAAPDVTTIPGAGPNYALAATDDANYALAYKGLTGLRTLTVDMVMGTSPGVYLFLDAPGDVFGTWFDLINGTIGKDDFAGTIMALGNGCYRLSTTGTSTGNIGFGICSGDGLLSSGGVGQTLNIFGASVS